MSDCESAIVTYQVSKNKKKQKIVHICDLQQNSLDTAVSPYQTSCNKHIYNKIPKCQGFGYLPHEDLAHCSKVACKAHGNHVDYLQECGHVICEEGIGKGLPLDDFIGPPGKYFISFPIFKVVEF